MKANRHDNNLPRRHYGHASRSAASAGSVTGEKVPASRVHTTSSVCPTARDHDCSSPGPLAVPTCGTIRRVSCTNQVPSRRSAIRPLPGKKGRSTVPISDRRASLGYIVTSDRAWSRSPSGPNVSGHPTRSRALCAACCGCTLDRARPRPPCPQQRVKRRRLQTVGRTMGWPDCFRGSVVRPVGRDCERARSGSPPVGGGLNHPDPQWSRGAVGPRDVDAACTRPHP